MAESTLIYAEPVLLYPEGCTERPWDDEESENSADADENAKAEEVANRRAIDFRRSQQSGGAGGASSMSLRSNYAPRHPLSRASRNPSPIRVKEPQSQSQSQSQLPPQPQPQPHLPTRPTSRPRSRAKVRPPSSSNNRLLSMGLWDERRAPAAAEPRPHEPPSLRQKPGPGRAGVPGQAPRHEALRRGDDLPHRPHRGAAPPEPPVGPRRPEPSAWTETSTSRGGRARDAALRPAGQHRAAVARRSRSHGAGV